MQTHERVLKLLTLAGKGLGVISSLNAIPGVSPHVGVIIFLVASCAKDVVTHLTDFFSKPSV